MNKRHNRTQLINALYLSYARLHVLNERSAELRGLRRAFEIAVEVLGEALPTQFCDRIREECEQIEAEV